MQAQHWEGAQLQNFQPLKVEKQDKVRTHYQLELTHRVPSYTHMDIVISSYYLNENM